MSGRSSGSDVATTDLIAKLKFGRVAWTDGNVQLNLSIPSDPIIYEDMQRRGLLQSVIPP